MVHCKPLGKNASRVWVDEVEVPEAPLFRPGMGAETLEDIQGGATAWPTDHIVMLED